MKDTLFRSKIFDIVIFSFLYKTIAKKKYYIVFYCLDATDLKLSSLKDQLPEADVMMR